jgi:trk system potassium uptake protein TrkA
LKFVIIGAGEVGSSLASYLASSGKEVVVIEQDGEKCAQLDEALDVNVIKGSGTNPEILRAAGLEDADLLLAVTDADEINT